MDGRRKEDRSKRRWMDSVNVDLIENGLSGERRRKTGLDGGNWSETSTPDRSGNKMQWKKYFASFSHLSFLVTFICNILPCMDYNLGTIRLVQNGLRQGYIRDLGA